MYENTKYKNTNYKNIVKIDYGDLMYNKIKVWSCTSVPFLFIGFRGKAFWYFWGVLYYELLF